MIIPLVSPLQCLTVQQNFYAQCDTVGTVFINVLIASLVSCQGSVIFLELRLFFSIWWLKATVEWAWIQVMHRHADYRSSSSLCGEDMFSKYMYAGQIPPTWLSLVKQSCLLCFIYTVKRLFPCYIQQRKCVVSTNTGGLIEVVVEALVLQYECQHWPQLEEIFYAVI